jgi:hypothetical protein
MNHSKRRDLAAGMALAAITALLCGLALPALAAPAAQFTPFPTPTPGPDGRILYIVQENDSWWRIAAIYNINLDQLLEVNGATRDTVLVVGSEILLGFGGPAEVTPTVGASPTPGPRLPTPTPQPGSGTLCVLVYHDRNGDSIRQEDEAAIQDGAISITGPGEVSLTEDTQPGLEPVCFADLPEGNYNISVAVPDGYNPTTLLNFALKVDPGAETYLDFGAQPSSQTQAEAAAPARSAQSLMLGIVGGLLLLGGIGLGVSAALLNRSRRKAPAE